MRVYLYVDGENFTIRAQELDGELKKDAAKTTALALRADFSAPPTDAFGFWGYWSPRAHRDVLNNRTPTKNGILFSKDEVYWDCLGLYYALGAALPAGRGQGPIELDRAHYFTGVAGPNIEQYERDLHAIGFSPHVSVRVKPESFALDMKRNEGITVISRPKPVDILIATRVLEDCMADNFDLCIFVGGDEDYVPLLEAVRRRGKEVWLVAFERWLAKRGRLRLTCDRFIAYDPMIAFRPLP